MILTNVQVMILRMCGSVGYVTLRSAQTTMCGTILLTTHGTASQLDTLAFDLLSYGVLVLHGPGILPDQLGYLFVG